MTVSGNVVFLEKTDRGKVQLFIIFGLLMESGKLVALGRIGKVFYYVGCVALILSGLVVLLSLLMTAVGFSTGAAILGLIPALYVLFFGALIMAGGLLLQWLPHVSEILTKILNSIERLNEEVGKLAQPSEGDVSVKEPEGEDI